MKERGKKKKKKKDREGRKTEGILCTITGFPVSSVGKECACNVGDLGLIPRLGKTPGEGKGYLLQYSDLVHSMDCVVHGVSKSQRGLIDFHFCTIATLGNVVCNSRKKLAKFL